MKKRLSVMFLSVLLLLSLCGLAAGETSAADRIASATQIIWAGGNLAALSETADEPIRLIRLDDGQVLLDEVNRISSTCGYACAETPSGTWLIDSAGNVFPLKKELKGDDWFPILGKYGLFFGDSEDRLCIYDPSADTFVSLPVQFSGDMEVYADSQGTVYVLATSGANDIQVFRADGTLVLDLGRYSFCLNCDCRYITNGCLTGCDADGAVVVSAFTGEEIARFDGYFWEPYDSDHQIYPDNTASIGPVDEDGFVSGRGTVIVSLDGEILKTLPKEFSFEVRFLSNSPAPVYEINVPIDSGFKGGVYNVLTDRTYLYDHYPYETEDDMEVTYTCLETGEHFKLNPYLGNYYSLENGTFYNNYDELINEGDPLPERADKYTPVGKKVPLVKYTDEGYMMIVSPDRSILGAKYWKELPWFYSHDRNYLAGYYPFDGIPLCAVRDLNDLCGVMDLQGNLVVPTEYDEVEYLQSFSTDPRKNGWCILARKDGRYYLFDENGIIH